MKYLKALVSLVWHCQLYLVVFMLLVGSQNDLPALFGYLASFVFSSLTIVLLLLVFRFGLRRFEFLIPLVLFAGVIYSLIHYFYVSGRSDMYWLGVYAAVIALIETVQYLYRQKYFLEKIHTFPLASHLLAGSLALGVWFFVSDFTSYNNDEALLTMILSVYIGTGIFMQGLQVLARNGIISKQTLKKYTLIYL